MSWTKREFINQAFEDAGMASYVYDLQPEQLQSALRLMDNMLAVWNEKGIRLSYPLPETPSQSSLDDLTNVPDSANEAICNNLAIRIAPSYGKVVPFETKVLASSSLRCLESAAARPPQIQFPGTMPAGAGNMIGYNYPRSYLPDPVEYIEPNSDNVMDFY